MKTLQNNAHLLSFTEWLERNQWPLIGREEDDDDDAIGDDDDDDLDLDDDDDDDEDGDEEVRLTKAEYKAMQRELHARRKKQEKAEARAKAERERQAAAQGRWEELAEERQAEAEEAKAEAEAAQYRLDQFQRNLRVQGAATRLGFKDPGDAIRFLDDADTDDDAKTERALKKLAEQKPYLVDERRPTGGAINGGGSGGLTMDQIKNMSRDEINENWQAVQAAMAANGS